MEKSSDTMKLATQLVAFTEESIVAGRRNLGFVLGAAEKPTPPAGLPDLGELPKPKMPLDVSIVRNLGLPKMSEVLLCS